MTVICYSEYKKASFSHVGTLVIDNSVVENVNHVCPVIVTVDTETFQPAVAVGLVAAHARISHQIVVKRLGDVVVELLVIWTRVHHHDRAVDAVGVFGIYRFDRVAVVLDKVKVRTGRE